MATKSKGPVKGNMSLEKQLKRLETKAGKAGIATAKELHKTHSHSILALAFRYSVIARKLA